MLSSLTAITTVTHESCLLELGKLSRKAYIFEETTNPHEALDVHFFFTKLHELEKENWLDKVYLAKTHQGPPPQIIIMKSTAMLILSAPASSASAERSFSSCGFVLSNLRTALSDENFEKMVIVRQFLTTLLRERSKNPMKIREFVDEVSLFSKGMNKI